MGGRLTAEVGDEITARCCVLFVLRFDRDNFGMVSSRGQSSTPIERIKALICLLLQFALFVSSHSFRVRYVMVFRGRLSGW